MRICTLLCAAVSLSCLAQAAVHSAVLSAQVLSSDPAPPTRLAEVRYDADGVDGPFAELLSFDPPELLPGDADRLVRVGVWDAAARDWAGATSLASAASFGRGYAPALVLALAPGAAGDLLSVSCRGIRLDAGASRDFAPRVVLLPARLAAPPELNRPVVLSPEGRKVGPPEEKSLLQRYWWVMVLVVLLLSTSGGGGAEKK